MASADLSEELPATASADLSEELPGMAFADLSEELPATAFADLSEELPATASADLSEELPATVSADLSEELPATASADLSEELPVMASADLSEELPAKASADLSEELPVMPSADLSEELPATASADLSEELLATASDDLSEELPATASADLSEELLATASDDLSEELPATASADLSEELPVLLSADLSEELECPVCLNVYTDPVTLSCGHNFCRGCMDHVLNIQEGMGGYSCPDCREMFQERPPLQTNLTLQNRVENFLSTQPDQEEVEVFCTYCIDFPLLAVKSCLLCDSSLCDKHLEVHSKAPEHVLCEPTTSLEAKKCSVHKKILEYYCTEDSACICVYCLVEEHRGHEKQTLSDALVNTKKKLRNTLQKLLSEAEMTERNVESLKEQRRKVQEKAAGETERVISRFRDLRRQLEHLERRVLSDIMRRAQQASLSCEFGIRQLEIKKEELSRKMRHIEKLCHMTDPLTVLQESDTGDLCDTEDRHDKQLHDGGDLDVAGISHTLHTGLANIMSGVTGGISVQPEDILLDVNTANPLLCISEDRKSASYSYMRNYFTETAERFQDYPQVMSSQSFSSGRHYWDMDIRGSPYGAVGICSPSINRRGDHSLIGYDNKSWGLYRLNNHYSVIHDTRRIQLPGTCPTDRVRIYLDYDAGQISFYALSHPIRHLHTFTGTFTEPLHVVVGIGLYGWGVKHAWKIQVM
ncbi:E3 ubiquitin-protein ligase TRIM11-like [Hyperolius riggenbachi]|uniref:E3 ubiquitin-protein ligase TRIM11-like n=1 Tax=Hyperolius riggenbachi TaxID=752182 RepID=UPI0035A322DF